MAEMVNRIYANFRGVDFRGEEINLTRSPDSVNMWKVYKETESIRTRPGLKEFYGFTDVHGIYFFKNELIVHHGTTLDSSFPSSWQWVDGKPTMVAWNTLHGAVEDKPGCAFVFNDVWYFKDGKNYLQYSGMECREVEGYIPTTSIGRKPGGGGSTYEDVNMLSAYRKNTFLADGKSKEFFLDARDLDNDFLPTVTVNDTALTGDSFSVDYEAGKITFTEAPGAPLTDGRDNVEVLFKKTVNGYRERIANCTLLQVFDNRVFFSGNPDYPNMVWHSSLNDPGYCSDLDYYQDGTDNASVRGLVAGNNALWVFREPSSANTTVFYHTPALDDDYGKIYPSAHSSVTTGCIGKAINFNDDIVFFSERGMEGISGDITTEQVLSHRSTLVDRKLTAEPSYKDMILEEWEGYLFAFIGDKAYLADSRTGFSVEDHIEYDWFYWDMGKQITCTCVKDGVLYLGTEDGIYTLNDMEGAVESWWVTPKDKFQYPHRQKTSNKRGCVAEATGDIDLYAKTEKTDFELIGTNKNVTDYFVSRIKRKKFKDIQLKFYSKTGFSLETVTLECFIGGYIKR